VRAGLGETTLRLGTAVVSIGLFLIVIWVMSNFYLGETHESNGLGALAAGLPTVTPTVAPPQVSFAKEVAPESGIARGISLHTSLPSFSRFEVIQYTVQKGDTIFGIAARFNLKPETVLWGNLYVLGDNPDFLKEGQQLNILPVDGVYHKWSKGEGLNGVAKYYGVKPEDIINWPGNDLSTATIGDLSNPKIEPGKFLIIPGGRREFSSWATPRITRTDPATAKILGPGYCSSVVEGAIGVGSFVWPTTEKYLSGYDYAPNANHFGIDIAGNVGNPIFASDHGVVVYAGWNDWGYGNMIVIDHGNGWQTLYAHLSEVSVSCGQSVYQGAQIATLGSTGNSSGPHLHFEMRSDKYGRPNPWDFLQR